MANSHKNLTFKIIFSKKIMLILRFFKKINFISNFFLFKTTNKYYFKIYPFYFKNLKIIKKFYLVSKPSRLFFLSLKAAQLLLKKSGSSIYLLSTTKGILTLNEALKKKTSGFLIGYFFI
jgi:ribosomal protein S8